MPPAPTAPLPGSMTVPPLFGWQHVLVALLVVVLAALVGLALLAAGRAGSERDEWQAFLTARSAQRRDQSADTSTSTAATEPPTAAP
jgi:hypothetical protein